MEIRDLLDSKIQNLEGEKVFLAREIMNLCGYFKWERFNGAILRAINDETNKDAEEHIFHVIKKDTGGRPREDYYLSYEGLLMVLKKSDQRKKEILELISYVEEILNSGESPKKIKKNHFKIISKYIHDNFNIDYLYISIILCLLLTSAYLYFNNKFTTNSTQIVYKTIPASNPKIENKIKSEISKEEQAQDKALQSYDVSIIRHNFLKVLENYINSGGSELHTFSQEYNKRSYFGLYLSGTDLIDAYFEFGNNGMYRESCSLLSKKGCLSSSKSDLSGFSNFWKKTQDGYDVLDVYDSGKKNSDGNEVFCVKYRYQLQNEQNYITETFNYSVKTIGNVNQIEQRFCEKIDKGGRTVSCPIKPTNYYCNK